MNEAAIEAVRQANAELQNAGLPTVTELLGLLCEAQRLGLTFDIGNAYIRRSYIDQQTDLNKRIDAARNAAMGSVLAA